MSIKGTVFWYRVEFSSSNDKIWINITDDVKFNDSILTCLSAQISTTRLQSTEQKIFMTLALS